jgi:hypothetical protein
MIFKNGSWIGHEGGLTGYVGARHAVPLPEVKGIEAGVHAALVKIRSTAGFRIISPLSRKRKLGGFLAMRDFLAAAGFGY